MAFFGEDPYANSTSQSMSVGDFFKQRTEGSVKFRGKAGICMDINLQAKISSDSEPKGVLSLGS